MLICLEAETSTIATDINKIQENKLIANIKFVHSTMVKGTKEQLFAPLYCSTLLLMACQLDFSLRKSLGVCE
jgi:hypothetical protein